MEEAEAGEFGPEEMGVDSSKGAATPAAIESTGFNDNRLLQLTVSVFEGMLEVVTDDVFSPTDGVLVIAWKDLLGVIGFNWVTTFGCCVQNVEAMGGGWSSVLARFELSLRRMDERRRLSESLRFTNVFTFRCSLLICDITCGRLAILL